MWARREKEEEGQAEQRENNIGAVRKQRACYHSVAHQHAIAHCRKARASACCFLARASAAKQATTGRFCAIVSAGTVPLPFAASLQRCGCHGYQCGKPARRTLKAASEWAVGRIAAVKAGGLHLTVSAGGATRDERPLAPGHTRGAAIDTDELNCTDKFINAKRACKFAQDAACTRTKNAEHVDGRRQPGGARQFWRLTHRSSTQIDVYEPSRTQTVMSSCSWLESTSIDPHV